VLVAQAAVVPSTSKTSRFLRIVIAAESDSLLSFKPSSLLAVLSDRSNPDTVTSVYDPEPPSG